MSEEDLQRFCDHVAECMRLIGVSLQQAAEAFCKTIAPLLSTPELWIDPYATSKERHLMRNAKRRRIRKKYYDRVTRRWKEAQK